MKRILSVVLLIVVVSSLVVFALPSVAFASPSYDLTANIWQLNDVIDRYATTSLTVNLVGSATIVDINGVSHTVSGSYVRFQNLTYVYFFVSDSSGNLAYPSIRYTASTGWLYYSNSSTSVSCPHGPVVAFTGGTASNNSGVYQWFSSNASVYVPPTYDVTYSGVGVTYSGPTDVSVSSWSFEVSLNTGFSWRDINELTVHNATVVSRTLVSADRYLIVVENAVGDVVVTYNAQPFVYNVTFNLDNVSLDSGPSTYSYGTVQEWRFTPTDYFKMPDNISLSYSSNVTVVWSYENFLTYGDLVVSYADGPFSVVVSGIAATFLDGYSSGYDVGYNVGLQIGYDNGYSDGTYISNNTVTESSASYIAGKNAGVASAGQYTFFGLISSIVEVPIKAFVGLTDFEILGVNLRTFYVSLLAFALLLTVLRLLLAR